MDERARRVNRGNRLLFRDQRDGERGVRGKILSRPCSTGVNASHFDRLKYRCRDEIERRFGAEGVRSKKDDHKSKFHLCNAV